MKSENSFCFALILFLLGSLQFPVETVAQSRCGSEPYSLIQVHEKYVFEQKEQFEQWIAALQKSRPSLGARQQALSYKVNIIVHVIHNGEPLGTGSNISDDQIKAQINVLNKDFNRLNEDAFQTPDEFRAIAGEMNIEFQLAKVSPDGSSANGINRVNGNKTFWTIEQHAEAKALSYWPAENYLNIWVCNLEGDFFGFTQFPVSTLPGVENSSRNRLTDGILISYRIFGSADYGDFNLEEPYNKGRGLTHEMGHFFGLRHLWGDVDGCSGSDYLNDTPSQSGPTYGCPSHPFPDCSSQNRMFQNYLDFTDDACMNLFTIAQVARMQIVLENSPRRASLLLPLSAREENPVFEKVFSPNGDGINDYWRWTNTLTYEGCKLLIFNRFGKLVYEKVSYDNTWDGRSSDGSILEEEAYYFVIRCDGKKDITGGVRIVR